MTYYYEERCESRTKYIVRTNDGKTTHKDGSPFWDIHIMTNKKLVNPHLKELEQQGYTRIGPSEYGQSVAGKAA